MWYSIFAILITSFLGMPITILAINYKTSNNLKIINSEIQNLIDIHLQFNATLINNHKLLLTKIDEM